MLLELLQDERPEIAAAAARALSHTLLVFDAFHDVLELSQAGNARARQVLQSWAEGEWFTSRPPLAEAITVTVFKIAGEINTDDLSPAAHATTRPDIPLHAQSMLESRAPGSLAAIAELKRRGYPVAFVGDVVGTGSSRKSALNSLLWHIGHDIPYVPNKRAGGVILGGTIAPIFFNTAEDAGALPIQCEVSRLETGMVVTIYPYEGVIRSEDGQVLSTFSLRPVTLPDEVRAGAASPS